MSRYKITPTNGGEPDILQADDYTFDPASARHTFTKGTGDSRETVATLVNVNVLKLPDEPSA